MGMICPSCNAGVPRSAFLGASGLSGIECPTCGAKLAATLESRLRLTGGGLLVGVCSGFLAQSLGAGAWLALASGTAVLGAWFAFRTERLLVLEPAEPTVPTIK